MFQAGAAAQFAVEGPVEAAQDSAEGRFVVGGLAETAEDGGDGTYGGQSRAPHVADDDADAVVAGDRLVEVAADGRGGVGREAAGGEGEAVQAGGEGAEQD